MSTRRRWQSESPSRSSPSPRTKWSSTRTKTVAFLTSTDLWQTVPRNRDMSDGRAAPRASPGTLSTRHRRVRSADSRAGGFAASLRSSPSARAYGRRHPKEASGLDEDRFCSALSAVCTISNGASLVH